MWDPRKPHVVLFKQVVHFGLQDLPRWHPSIHKHRSAPARWEEGRGDPSDTTRLMVYWRDGVSYVRMLAGKHAEGLRVRAPGLASGGCHPGLESSGKEKSWPKKAYSSKEGTTRPDAGHSLHIYKMGITPVLSFPRRMQEQTSEYKWKQARNWDTAWARGAVYLHMGILVLSRPCSAFGSLQ